MRLLVLTQKLDRKDAVLGFMHGWIHEFARQSEKVIVVALSVGDHDLPKNVTVLSLGKELGRSRARAFSRFFSYIWQYRNEYDAVFVHMNQIYVLLGGLVWRVLGKYVTLWYAHGHTPFSLYPAVALVHRVFTSTESGMRIRSRKKTVVGQGIDTDKFAPVSAHPTASANSFQIISVGRISRSKDYETLFAAADELVRTGRDFKITLVGGPLTEDDLRYQKELVSDTQLRGIAERIIFAGAVANSEIVPYLHSADLFVNMGLTGSLDKAVPEAMAAGLPILTCNEALREVLGPELSAELLYPKHDGSALAHKISWVMGMSGKERDTLGMHLREIVVHNHSLKSFVSKIILYLPQ